MLKGTTVLIGCAQNTLKEFKGKDDFLLVNGGEGE